MQSLHPSYTAIDHDGQQEQEMNAPLQGLRLGQTFHDGPPMHLMKTFGRFSSFLSAILDYEYITPW